MQTIAIVISFASGFALIGYHGSAANLLVTSLAVDASLAPLTTVIAIRRGRAALPWAIGGFVFGAWALIAALLVPARNREPKPPPSQFPSTSDAA